MGDHDVTFHWSCHHQLIALEELISRGFQKAKYMDIGKHRLHERCLKIICNNKQCSCIESLENKLLNDSVSIYVKYLHDLATEMYNVSDNL